MDRILRHMRIPHTRQAAAQNSLKLIERAIVGLAVSVLAVGCFGWAVLGLGEGVAQAKPTSIRGWATLPMWSGTEITPRRSHHHHRWDSIATP